MSVRFWVMMAIETNEVDVKQTFSVFKKFLILALEPLITDNITVVLMQKLNVSSIVIVVMLCMYARGYVGLRSSSYS